jgi:hypothetical protein
MPYRMKATSPAITKCPPTCAMHALQDEHPDRLEQLDDFKDQIQRLEAEIKSYQANDPDLLRTMSESLQISQEYE